MNNSIKHNIEWTGDYIQFLVAVHTLMEKITYTIQLRLWNDMLSVPNISTGGSLNKRFRVIETPEQEK